MPVDIRSQVAKYYDFQSLPFDDLSFYRQQIMSQDASVLELGCGTGRVLIPLAKDCRYIQGIDASEAMLDICREKVENAELPPERVKITFGDITDFDLGRTFDLIIAPFRVIQNLDADAEVEGMFSCVRKHLSPGGKCILNVFKPLRDPDTLLARCTGEEVLSLSLPIEGGRIEFLNRQCHMDRARVVLYPELMYRRYEGEVLVEDVSFEIPMRCYYPEQFEKLIADHGFQILDKWGGYAGERYGEGNELVVAFRDRY